MSDIPTIPVVERVPSGWNEDARTDERERETDEWFTREGALCETFQRTGQHEMVRDESPTFMHGGGKLVWAGHMRHCSGTRLHVSRFGQQRLACVVFDEEPA